MAGGLAEEGLGDTDKLLSGALAGDTISSVNSLFEGKLTKSAPLPPPPTWGRMQPLSSSQSFLTPSSLSFFHMPFFKSSCFETLNLPHTSYYPLFTVHIPHFSLHIFSLFSFLACHFFFPFPHLTDIFFFIFFFLGFLCIPSAFPFPSAFPLSLCYSDAVGWYAQPLLNKLASPQQQKRRKSHACQDLP